MKKLSLILIIFLTTASLFAQTSPSWKWIHPKPQGQNINWFKIIDANTWYAAGDYGVFLKSTDAGATWKTSTGGYPSSLYPGAGIFQNFKSGFFFNANTGYLGVQAVRGIVKTTNGGLTFDTLQIVQSGSGTASGIYFLNYNTGYICGNSTFKVQKTTDGGLTWRMLPNLGTSTLYAIYASDTNNIIVGGSTSGKLFKTSNAGTTWDTVNLSISSTIYNITFINSSTGYLCGSSGLFRYTTNGGANWAGSNPGTTASMYNIAISGNSIYICGTESSGILYQTTDLGTTWNPINYGSSSTISPLYGYAFDINGTNMIVAGTNGEMVKSTNSGTNWSSMSYRRSVANLNDLYAESGTGRIIAIGGNLGASDVIMYSPDGGNTWATANFAYFEDNGFLSNIDMLSPTTGFISGRWGRFLKTTDGGQTWDTTKTGNSTLTPYFCNGVSFINETTGWITGGTAGIGGNTKIWKTTDGGSNWVEQTSAYAGPVGVKIQMVNENAGYLTCSGGLQKTTNSGVNWTMTTNPGPTGTSYSPLKVIDSLTVFTGGNNSQVYRTTNGGANWDSLNFPVKAGTIFCTDWYNKDTGCAGAVIGVVGTTTNGGQSWQMYNIGGYTVYQIKMVHPDTIFAVCGNTSGAQIFKYVKQNITGGFSFENSVPTDYTLRQNYPNPFNPSTTIEFTIPKTANVSLKIYDMRGREIATEISGLNLIRGTYKMNFNASNLASGVYFYSLVVDGSVMASKKMVLMK